MGEMNKVQFVKAEKYRAKARIALIGISGSGKTYSALRLAQALTNNSGIALIDTEGGSASKYADVFDFNTLELNTFHPNIYINAIHAAEQAGFDVLIVDSLSHAWFGKEGELELVDNTAKASRSGNTYFAWREVTPLHNKLIDTILQSSLHIIATMRAKASYIIEERNGKQVPRKVGMAPVMREGMEYEFDIVFDLDADNTGIVSKTRCSELHGKTYSPLTEETGKRIAEWLQGVETPKDNQALISTLDKKAEYLRMTRFIPVAKMYFSDKEKQWRLHSPEEWLTELNRHGEIIKQELKNGTSRVDNGQQDREDAAKQEQAGPTQEELDEMQGTVSDIFGKESEELTKYVEARQDEDWETVVFWYQQALDKIPED